MLRHVFSLNLAVGWLNTFVLTVGTIFKVFIARFKKKICLSINSELSKFSEYHLMKMPVNEDDNTSLIYQLHADEQKI